MKCSSRHRKFPVTEIGVELPPTADGRQLLSPDNGAGDGRMHRGWARADDNLQLLEIYFQNPQFGYYFLVLTSQRLLENISRLEAIMAQNKIAPPSAAADGTG